MEIKAPKFYLLYKCSGYSITVLLGIKSMDIHYLLMR